MLGASRQRPTPPPALRTELALALPPPPPTTPEPPPPLIEHATSAPKPRPAPHIQPTREPPTPAATPIEAGSPELTGKTLTGAGDADWAAPAGNAAERGGPIHIGSAPPAPPPTRPASIAAPAATTEPLTQLSRKPVPPALAAALERNYPAAARSQGRSGEAKVRALIDAQGRVSSVTVSFESAPEFGAACQKTLLPSRWTPPLGQLGKPTATFITYRCKFRVDE